MHGGASDGGEWRCVGGAGNNRPSPIPMNGIFALYLLLSLAFRLRCLEILCILWFWPCYIITKQSYGSPWIAARLINKDKLVELILRYPIEIVISKVGIPLLCDTTVVVLI